VKKKRLQFTIFKKLTGSVQFQFDKPETEKTEPNRIQNRKKNRAKPELVFVLKNRTETDQFELFQFKKNDLIIFLIKTKQKIMTNKNDGEFSLRPLNIIHFPCACVVTVIFGLCLLHKLSHISDGA
jgi:hypothetical protein